MDHGGEAARLTTVESTVLGLAGVVQGSESNIGSGTFDGQLGAAAAPTGSFSDFDLSAVHRQTGPGVAYANISEFWQQPGPVHVVLVGPQLPDGVMPVYSVLQTRTGARRGVVLVDLLPGGGGGGVDADNYAYYALQPRPGVGHGEVLVDLLPDSAGHSEVFVGLLPGDGVAVHDDYGYYPWQPRPGAGRGVVLVDLLPGGGCGGGVVYNWDYALQPRPGAGHGEVLVDLLRHGAGHGEVFVGLIPGSVDADNYGYYALQPRPGAGHGEVLVDPLPDGAEHGEVFVGLLPGGGGGTVHDDYGYYPWQPRPGAARGEVFIGPLPDGVGMVLDGLGNFAQQNLPGTGGADGIGGMVRDPNLNAGYDGSGALADDLGAVYDDPGMAAAHLRRLLPFVGIGACSVAVNGLAAGPGSPAVAFHLFVLLLGGLFLVILHVLRV